MDRRRLLGAATAGLSALAWHALAQKAPARIGWLSPNENELRMGTYESFLEGMRELGYAPGRDFVVDARWAEGSNELLASHAAALVRAQPDVIVTQTVAVTAVLKAGRTGPIVFAFSGDPIIAKLADSLPKPGRNLTGITLLALDLVGKRLELLREVVPSIKRVAVLANPAHPGEEAERNASLAAAKQLGLEAQYLPLKSAADLPPVLAAAQKARADAIVMFPDNGTMRYSGSIAEFSRKARIPAISGWAEFAEKGNVLSYGPNLQDSYRRLSGYVDKILKGASPATLPIELPTRVELVVNQKAAQAIGLKVPRSVLLRADRVIE